MPFERNETMPTTSANVAFDHRSGQAAREESLHGLVVRQLSSYR
jgi:hypothetical protein